MPRAEFFTRLGLFIERGFLDQEFCAAILAGAPDSGWAPARVNKDGGSVNAEVRRSLKQTLPPSQGEYLNARLRALLPRLENHFQVALTGFETPQLLRYTEGCFFSPHRDRAVEGHDSDEKSVRRQISVSMFLNGETDSPQKSSYCGGSLAFYGLMSDPRATEYGFPLIGERGLLVGFRSETPHEVKPITHGERFTIVSWFF
jgi:SM-20-related protein